MTQPITFNLADGSVRFSFSPAAAQELKTALDEIMTALKTAAAEAGESSRRSQAQPLEHRYTGDVFLEVFCNPNIWPSPFAAKALITLRDDRIRLTTETALSQLYEDISVYLDSAG
jgi:hypothetical protein